MPPGGDALTRPRPPWWWVRSDTAAGTDPAATVVARGRAAGLAVHVVRGERLRTSGGLFAEYARVWRFPSYFGHNWSALKDCLTDLAWLPAEGYLGVVTGAGDLLRDEPDDVLGLYLDLLARVGADWSAPTVASHAPPTAPLPFHTALCTRSDTAAARLLARAAAGGADLSAGGNGA